jgi:UDP-N-acetylglucosamine:LPS N-acetylglucosamine transferase
MSLAEALCDRLQSDYTIEILDPQPIFFHWHYRLVSRYASWLWAAEFRLTDTPKKALLAHAVFTMLVTEKINTILDQVRPDMIITTYPFLTYEVRHVLKKRSSSVPFAMLFSDANGVHASWLIERDAVATFATTRESYQQALKAGFDPERLHLVGWPVRAQFYRTDGPSRAKTLADLNLDTNCFTLFIQGGGEGAAKFERTIESVLAANVELQVIIAVGTNKALLERFKGVRNVYPLPFTKEIAPFMAAADVVMGKAGPNVLFEAVTLGKPFIATSYIPGQEEANLEFIRRHQLGWVVLDPEKQCELVASLATRRTELSAVNTAVQAYRRWNLAAMESLVPLIHSLIPAQ